MLLNQEHPSMPQLVVMPRRRAATCHAQRPGGQRARLLDERVAGAEQVRSDRGGRARLLDERVAGAEQVRSDRGGGRARLLDERVAGAEQVREGRAVGDDAVQAVLLQRLRHRAERGLDLGQRALEVLLGHLRAPQLAAVYSCTVVYPLPKLTLQKRSGLLPCKPDKNS